VGRPRAAAGGVLGRHLADVSGEVYHRDGPGGRQRGGLGNVGGVAAVGGLGQEGGVAGPGDGELGLWFRCGTGGV
jgi:hypothetical protein